MEHTDQGWFMTNEEHGNLTTRIRRLEADNARIEAEAVALATLNGELRFDARAANTRAEHAESRIIDLETDVMWYEQRFAKLRELSTPKDRL